MLKTATFILIAAAAMVLYGCGDDAGCTAGELQCSGDQVQTCLEDGTWSEPADCPEAGQTCSSGHDGMEFVHCMAENHGEGDHSDHSDHSDDTASDEEDHSGHGHD